MASSRVTQFTKPVPETGRGVGLAEMRHQEGLDPDRRCRLDDLAQFGMQRNLQMRLFAAVGLAFLSPKESPARDFRR